MIHFIEFALQTEAFTLWFHLWWPSFDLFLLPWICTTFFGGLVVYTHPLAVKIGSALIASKKTVEAKICDVKKARFHKNRKTWTIEKNMQSFAISPLLIVQFTMFNFDAWLDMILHQYIHHPSWGPIYVVYDSTGWSVFSTIQCLDSWLIIGSMRILHGPTCGKKNCCCWWFRNPAITSW